MLQLVDLFRNNTVSSHTYLMSRHNMDRKNASKYLKTKSAKN